MRSKRTVLVLVFSLVMMLLSVNVGQATSPTSAESYNGAVFGSSLFMPFTPKNWFGLTATIAIMSGAAGAGTATISFRDDAGNEVATYPLSFNVNTTFQSMQVSLASVPNLPDGFAGSALITNVSSGDLAAVVNIDQNGYGNRSAYEAQVGANRYCSFLFCLRTFPDGTRLCQCRTSSRRLP